MEPIRLSIQEAIIYTALINAAVGFFLGLIPLCFGFFNGRKKLGILGIVSSTIGGAVLGIYFSFPTIAIFMWLIIESKVARIGISAFLSLIGIALAVFAYVRLTSEPAEISGAQDPIFWALMIGGGVFTLVGIILLVLSFLRTSRNNIEEPMADLSL